MYKIEFLNYASLKMSRGKFSVEEVVDLREDESGLAEVLHGLDLDHDADRDREEADFVAASGTSELVPIALLRADYIQEEEPAFQGSMLLLDDSDSTDGKEGSMILVHHFKQRACSVNLIHHNHKVMSVVIIHPVIQIAHSMFEAGAKGAEAGAGRAKAGAVRAEAGAGGGEVGAGRAEAGMEEAQEIKLEIRQIGCGAMLIMRIHPYHHHLLLMLIMAHLP